MKHYFLFGERPCESYDSDNLEHVIELLGYSEGALHIHDDKKHDAFDLLDAFNGWLDYRVITKEEYNQFKTKSK
jgi:hypothetical protein